MCCTGTRRKNAEENFLHSADSRRLVRLYFIAPDCIHPLHCFWAPQSDMNDSFPIRTINFSDATDKARHDCLVQLVEQMLEAKRELAQARADRDRSYYENKCAALDRQIDRLDDELYDLTDEEIAIGEAS